MVQEAWRRGECLRLNGVYFGQDLALLLDVRERGVDLPYDITVSSRVSVQEAAQTPGVSWTSLLMTCTHEGRTGLTVVGGEGFIGSDGFIALVHTASSKLIWLMYCDRCNPFDRVTIKTDAVEAHSTFGYRWRLPIDDPTDIGTERVDDGY